MHNTRDMLVIWMISSLLPQLLLVLMILFCQLGYKMTLSILLKWPGMLLISLFSPFMFSCEKFNGKMYLTVSKKWTIINLSLSILFTFSGRCFYDFFHAPSSGIPIQDGFQSFLLTLNVCLPLYVFSIICYTILLKCKVNGKHFYQRSAMNIEDWNDIIVPDDFKDGTDLELGELLEIKTVDSEPFTLNFSHRIVCIPKSLTY